MTQREVNRHLQGILVMPCPRGCGATLRTRVVFYRSDANEAAENKMVPIEAPGLPGELLLHWINCPRALDDCGE